MKKYTLNVQKRELLGRKVRQLRRNKILPGNVFGKNIMSIAVQINTDDFLHVYKEAGETGIVEVDVAGEKRPVLIQNVQLHPVTAMPLHVDLHQVDLKEKVRARVPLEVIGSAPAVDQKRGVLLTLLDGIEVETLPADLPEKITIDVTKLLQVGDTIKVMDLKLPSGVVPQAVPETEIVKIGELVTKEAEALVQEEEALKAQATTEAAPTAVAAEAKETPPEAQKPAPDSSKSEKPA